MSTTETYIILLLYNMQARDAWKLTEQTLFRNCIGSSQYLLSSYELALYHDLLALNLLTNFEREIDKVDSVLNSSWLCLVFCVVAKPVNPFV